MDGTTNAVRHIQDLISAIEDVILPPRGNSCKIAKRISKPAMPSSSDAATITKRLLECALKLKEIAYIHAEAYAGGELKHGPIALIEKETPVIGLISDPISALALRNNLEELKSRGATIIIVATKALKAPGDDFVINDVKPYLAGIAKVVFGQYLPITSR
jgi:glucosamine 6-phosphate synthetase-like amidotransferase/phosphosugar isomerase protein